MAADTENLIALTADIVAAHVSHNSVAPEALSSLIENVFLALQAAGAPAADDQPAKPVGAVSARASVKADRLISMIDGKPYKMLKRHLSLNGYTPQSYRETFGLPRDYPMVAAEYAQKRRDLAHKIGLGRKPKEELKKPARKPRLKKAAAVARMDIVADT
ncbi:MucR family transcriptional regulator [Novosphingobium sp. P6W]|uniref:MucR family transcriptional regulator n=1 Tax=Novosphingobium sp. P6W TaxID=1609758 RepID=UPI0005C2EB8E|nr:MucR family transcriptional regulator [Novosphingobium sp. P6W]AXB75923.1 transcriptional regulator [Novosphingobium sp. P6W]KIS29932.1 transcriptional regulator [Novosphingobium sp. P6W]